MLCHCAPFNKNKAIGNFFRYGESLASAPDAVIELGVAIWGPKGTFEMRIVWWLAQAEANAGQNAEAVAGTFKVMSS